MKKNGLHMVFLLLFTLFALIACQKEPVTLYQIGFETNGGSAMDNLVLEAGAELTMPAEPQKDGQTFAGWYLDEGLTEPFTVPETMPAESFWLFADWEVTLTFDSQGGDAIPPIKGEAGTILGQLPAASYDDNLFLGWYLDKEYTQKLGLVMPKANTTVYARWQALESTTVLDITDSIQINNADCYEMETVDDGYKITAKEGKGEWDYFYFTLDFNVKEYSTFELVVEGKAGTSYMTKVEQGGVSNREEARTLSGGEEVIYWTVDAANLTETGGEKFIIFLNQGVKGVAADALEYITVKSIKLYRGKDLNAEEEQVIFFDTDGGSAVSSLFAAEGEKIAAPEEPERAGYAFTGWYSDADCTAPFTFTTMPAGPTVVYAGWEEASGTDPDIDLSNYELLDWQPTLGYWFSKDGASPDKLLTSQKLYVSSGVRFSREDLPNGTIIILESGYQYRPDGWTSETENSADRPGNVTTHMVVVDDAWWGEYVLRGFNVSKIQAQDMSAAVEETGQMLKIYVPKE